MSKIKFIDNTYKIPTSYEINDVDLNSTVLIFKTQIKNQTGLEASLLILTFNGSILDNKNTLTSYEITNGSVINNTSKIIFLSIINSGKTVNIMGFPLDKSIIELASEAINKYNINRLNIPPNSTWYYNGIILKNSNELIKYGIKYGSTIKSFPTITQKLENKLPTPVPSPIPTPVPSPIPTPSPVPNPVSIQRNIESKFVLAKNINPLQTKIVNPLETINNDIKVTTATSINFEAITDSPNLIVIEKSFGYVKSESNSEIKEVLISERKVKAKPIISDGVAYQKFSATVINQNLSEEKKPEKYVQKITYSITNPNSSEEKKSSLESVRPKLKLLLGNAVS